VTCSGATVITDTIGGGGAAFAGAFGSSFLPQLLMASSRAGIRSVRAVLFVFMIIRTKEKIACSGSGANRTALQVSTNGA
jgi:hypothetical protein